jgi:hypothetical protein
MRRGAARKSAARKPVHAYTETDPHTERGFHTLLRALHALDVLHANNALPDEAARQYADLRDAIRAIVASGRYELDLLYEVVRRANRG